MIKRVNWISFFLLAFILTGCAIKGYVPDDKTILINNSVSIETDEKHTISSSEVSNYIIQQADRNLFKWLPRVWVYYKTANKTGAFGKWVNRSIGHKPTYFNAQSTNDSKRIITDYLDNIGYFKSKVTATKTDKNKRTEVVYHITPTKPYYIRNISYKVSDTLIMAEIKKLESSLPVKEGDIYNTFTMDNQRELITTHLRNNGYFFFDKDMILYEIDTNLRQNQADITLRIDGKKHDKYIINDVFVYPDYNVNHQTDTKNDTISHVFTLGKKKNNNKHEFNFIIGHKPKVNFKTFDQVILIHPGDIYSQHRVSQSYRALGGLKLYRFSNISFDTIPSDNDSLKKLNCTVKIQKGKLHHYNIQIEGTNSGGDLGASGSVSYRNNNIFRGSELLRISVRGGFQAQRVESIVTDEGLFNTKELGVDASILFPRFVSPIRLNRFVLEYQPKTTLSTGFNMQIRPLYSRYIFTGSFGYNWKTSDKIEHILTPINMNTVKVLPTDLFAFILSLETNQRIKDQYTDHLILGTNYSFIYSNQNINSSHDFIYFKADFESSGNFLSLFNNTPLITTNKNYHEIIGIRYAQYVKFQLDFRFYHYLNKDNILAFRFMYGQGFAYGNSVDIPFEKTFYSGGTNGMRGWRFRSLGPGEFNNSLGFDIERIGDLKLEFNMEYRYPLYAFLKGAIFCDVGNIWTLGNNESYPGGQFEFDTFYKQLAVDAGIGLRLDFSFFLIRLDIAAPLHDPSYAETERWRISKLGWYDVVWNFGIGYPF